MTSTSVPDGDKFFAGGFIFDRGKLTVSISFVHVVGRFKSFVRSEDESDQFGFEDHEEESLCCMSRMQRISTCRGE